MLDTQLDFAASLSGIKKSSLQKYTRAIRETREAHEQALSALDSLADNLCGCNIRELVDHVNEVRIAEALYLQQIVKAAIELAPMIVESTDALNEEFEKAREARLKLIHKRAVEQGLCDESATPEEAEAASSYQKAVLHDPAVLEAYNHMEKLQRKRANIRNVASEVERIGQDARFQLESLLHLEHLPRRASVAV